MEHIVIATQARYRAIAVFIALTAAFTSPAHAQDNSYHILLTNDDGIESAGIQALAEQLRATFPMRPRRKPPA